MSSRRSSLKSAVFFVTSAAILVTSAAFSLSTRSVGETRLRTPLTSHGPSSGHRCRRGFLHQMVASVPKVANAEATTRASAVAGKRLHVQVDELNCYASIYFPSTQTQA